mgnify:CR=1 FL=1
MPPVHEFDLIARIRQRAAARGDVVLGIGDDCALLLPPPGMQLAVTMDALNVACISRRKHRLPTSAGRRWR